MTLWRNIASFAARRGARAVECDTCPDGLPGEDPRFSAAVTALGAKLAKADGTADHGEFLAFSEVFQPEPASQRDVHRLYDLARQTTRGFESYARQLAKRYRACPGLLEDVLDGLFHIAKADGAVTAEEVSYIQRVSQLFGLSALTFRRIKAQHLGAPAGDPYVLLDVPADAADDIVHGAWKRAIKALHPDRAAGQGLGEDQIREAQTRSAELNAAYDQVMRERHELLAVQAV